MAALRRSDLESVLALAEVAAVAEDPGALAAAVLPGLARLVGSDLAAYGEVGWRRSFVVEHPAGSVGPAVRAAFDRSAAEHPLIAHYRRTGDQRPRTISEFLDRQRFQRLDLYRDVFRPLGVEHQVAFTVVDRTEPAVVGVALSRAGQDFTERDRTVLALARPHLVAAHRRVVAQRRRDEVLAAVERAADREGQGLVVLDRHRRVCLATALTRRVLEERCGPVRDGARLPGPLDDWLRAQHRGGPKKWAHATSGPFVLAGPSGCAEVWLVAAADGDGDILVVVERAVAASPGGAPPVGDLTPREVEVLDAVAEGRTNAQVAQALRLSPRTVQKHLEHVFEKLGVDNRTAAVRAARDRT